jgi:serine/threonine protein kinase
MGAAGSKLGRYELLARIATGGMGEIFLARLAGAAGFEKLCVIKRILPHLASDERFRAMLIAEARIASNMSHANICHVYELDEIAGELYLVMEYLEGVTVLQLLRTMSERETALDLGLVAGMVQQACEGLHYAHELRDRNGSSLGVVHRDVSPSNLFVTESGVVKIVDFGVAKAHGTIESPGPGEVKGKYAYMAPEQLRGQEVDRRVDVFSLAVVVYEMLTCRRLYQRKTDEQTFRAILAAPEIDLARLRPDAPVTIAPVLRRALARDPAARYGSARQFATALFDAFGPVRPWGQGDISELVRSVFADEISRNNEEISAIVHRNAGDDHAIPVILRHTSDPDGSDYLSIETDGEDRATAADATATARIDSVTDARADAMMAAMTSPIRTPPARRRGGLAIGGIVGGAAIVLAVGIAVIDRAAEPTAIASAAAATPSAEPPPAPRARPHAAATDEPYGAALTRYAGALDQCARDHRDGLPAGARAVLLVGVDGRAKEIAIEPASVAPSALAGCIRGILREVAFPVASDEKQVALGLAVDR